MTYWQVGVRNQQLAVWPNAHTGNKFCRRLGLGLHKPYRFVKLGPNQADQG